MLTRDDKKGLETLEWIGIGVVLIIAAMIAYQNLGGQIVGWVSQVAGAI